MPECDGCEFWTDDDGCTCADLADLAYLEPDCE